MFTAVALNPSMDKTVVVENFQVNITNRISKCRIDPSGKGINVAIAAKTLGEETNCTGFLFKKNGDDFEQVLNKHGIVSDFVWCEGEVRTNMKIIDPVNKTMTEVNSTGEKVSREKIEEVKNKVEEYAAKSSIMVFSGSLPPGAQTSLYRELIEICNKYDAMVYLDTYGDALKEGIKGKPFMVKPNTFELEVTLGKKLINDSDIVEGARQLVQMGIQCVVVSMGSKGAIGIYRNKAYKADPVAVQVETSVGAGDCLTTGIAAAMEKTGDFEYALRWGSACATSCVTKEGSQLCTVEDAKKYFGKVNVYPIS